MNDLAGRIEAAPASVEAPKVVVEASGDLSPEGFQHVAAVALARQPALTTLARSRPPAGGAFAAAEDPVIASRAASGAAGTGNLLALPAVGPPPPARRPTAPRA